MARTFKYFGSGSARVETKVDGIDHILTIHSVLYFLELTYNLVTVLETRQNYFQTVGSKNSTDPTLKCLEMYDKPSEDKKTGP